LNKDLELRLEVMNVCFDLHLPTRQTRLFVVSLAEMLWELGRWQEAYDKLCEVFDGLPAKLCDGAGGYPPLILSAYACGKEPKLPIPFVHIKAFGAGRVGCQPRTLFYSAVRTNRLPELNKHQAFIRDNDSRDQYAACQVLAVAALVDGDG